MPEAKPAFNNLELPASIGFALSQWSAAEIRLSHLFSTLSDMPDKNKAHQLFDGVISLEVRLSLCNSLMLHENIEEVEFEMWVRLRSKIMAMYKMRHQIAHFTLVADVSGAGIQATHVSPFWSIGKFNRGETTYLSLADIRERAGNFSELRDTISWFWTEALKRRDMLKALPAQETALLIRIRESSIECLSKRKSKSRDSQL